MLDFLLFLLLFLTFLQLILTYEDPRYNHCGSTSSFKYTPNSTFSNNLSEAFSILRNSTAATNYNSTTYTANGTAPVTALAVCRGDITPSDCQPCVDAATTDIFYKCPYHSSAEIWYNLCMMRYSDQDFIGRPDNTVHMMIWDNREVENPNYDEKVQKLARNLSIASGDSKARFAVGWTLMENDTKLHGYQECSRDLSSEDCTNCLLNATRTISSCCLGKWAGWIGTASCQIRFNMDPIYNESNIFAPEIFTDDMKLPPTLPPARVMKGKKSRSWTLVVGAVIVIILVTGGIWLWVATAKKRQRMISRRVSRDVEDEVDGETRIAGAEGSGSFLFDYEMLVIATENFSPTNRLGVGGFGSVYKGVTSSGEAIAVKKLAVGSDQGAEEFSNEVVLLLRMQHRHLVKLLGCCAQGDEKMLVYEYLHNKSLDCYIFDKSKSALLDWPKRFNIIVGIARGLLYLHEDSQLRIIHRDIKAANILLDEQMNAKISDFGLARLFPDELTQIRTRRIAGTIGYMAPEYAVRGILSAKSDVYSFGVLILEIISGRKNYDIRLEEQNKELLNLAWRLEQEGSLMELVDVTIGSFSQPEVSRCLRIGLMCCQENTQIRPTMSSIVVMLSDESVSTPLLGRPAYQRSMDNTNEAFIGSDSVHSTITMTSIQGR